ncbi:MAG TPA: heavy metal translocating P-type ATPase metal-binding domain-containing protein [Calditrichia bacterium]|nr:heavy metal translocating P-type ATPase metal-binding domain-containing protein [Calditrichota bacterium]HQV31128.1 heavy metal translocating P-type ATPase metal-binding domain-containing protein [Calditrichia bacterium]
MLKTLNTAPAGDGDLTCHHCGLPCSTDTVVYQDKHFCCKGCQTVFELLSENDLCEYYQLNDTPGLTLNKREVTRQFDYLDDPEVRGKLLDYHEGEDARVTFYIPDMHCSSCIWLLEQLQRLNGAIRQSRVDFLRKQLALRFNSRETSLRQVVELLTSIGYEPRIALDDLEERPRNSTQRSLYIKIAVAGFAFGNIMLLSFPEYLAVTTPLHQQFREFFGFLNILLALPVLFYSASGYLKSAWQGLRHRTVNIDVPLSMGILTFFFRSLYDILSGTGAGYMDSFAGLVFLLLVGKLFQQKTFDTLSFERDYKSFFPVAITVKKEGREQQIPLSRLTVGDRILIRHRELIPADAVLIQGEGAIDYSFVTGEADPVSKSSGDTLFAGGRQTGGLIEVEVVKEVSQSYLTQLWNNEAFQKSSGQLTGFANAVSRYFTAGILTVAIAALLFWMPVSLALAINAFTAVLIIACPCALALSTPFTLGSTLRIFSRLGFYLKNTDVVETLARSTHLVFDKTGTLTRSGKMSVSFEGDLPLNADELGGVHSLVSQSIHPLSLAIYQHTGEAPKRKVEDFREVTGQGIEGTVNGRRWRLGSAQFVGCPAPDENRGSLVFISIDGQMRGLFRIRYAYREGMSGVITSLKRYFRLALLSGDNNREEGNLAPVFGEDATLAFQQSPADKLAFVEKLQGQGASVVMIGDGLNDAGALRKSDVGISISEDLNSFSPACDGILEASRFALLPQILAFSKASMRVVYLNFAVSLVYNVVGLSFAVQGTLSPLICAILMPLSSITAIVISTVATHLLGRYYGFHHSEGMAKTLSEAAVFHLDKTQPKTPLEVSA